MPMNYEDDLRFDPLIVEQDNIEYWRERFEQRRNLIASPIVARVLYEYYSDDQDHFYKVSYDGDSRAFPVFTKEAWSETLMDPADVIQNVDGSDWHRDYDKQFIWDTCMQQASLSLDPTTSRQQIEVRDHVWNNPLHRIDSLTETDDGFHVDVGMTDYYTYVSHAMRIVEELYDHCQRFNITADSDPEEAKDLLVDRLQFRDKIAPSFRAMAKFGPYHTLGMLTTTLVKLPDGNHYVVIVDRSEHNVDYPDAIGIAPSGVSAPLYDPEDEADIEYLVKREFGEEVFSRDEFRHPPEDVSSKDWVDNSSPVRTLGELLDGEGADMYTTGFAFNCMSSASQLSNLLYIHDTTYAEWVRDAVEVEDTQMMEGELRLIPVDEAMKSALSDRWAPGAAVSMAQSLHAADRELDIDLLEN